MVLSGIRPSFPGLSRSAGQITHVLLTRSPLEYPASRAFPFDLHVLSTPPAFVLSQDQTLHKKISEQNPKQAVKSPKPNKRTNHHKPQSNAACAGVQKITTNKKSRFPQPDGAKKGNQKVEHNHMPTNPSQCSRNTKQHSNEYVFHIPNRHTPTNKPLSLLADKPINTQPCTQKIKSTLAHY